MNFKSFNRAVYALLILVYLALFVSCEYHKELDYYEKYDSPQLIVHGYICPQYGVQVIVKKATSPSDVSGDDRILNANVFLLTTNTEFIQLRQLNDYLFECDSLSYIEENKSYYLRIVSDEFGESFSGKEKILHAPQIDSVRIVTEPRKVAIVYFNNNYSNGESFIIESRNYKDGRVERSDALEKFNPFSIERHVQHGFNAIERSLYGEFDSVQIVLHVISPVLTKFLVSQQNYDTSKEDPFYPQPYPVFTNISGGYGIFASHSFDTVVAKK